MSNLPVPLPKDLAKRIELGQITCKDGTTVSVQASAFHYCEPRNNEGPWSSVEVGYPSVEPSWWSEHTDGYGIAGWVPIEKVRQFIREHGGPA